MKSITLSSLLAFTLLSVGCSSSSDDDKTTSSSSVEQSSELSSSNSSTSSKEVSSTQTASSEVTASSSEIISSSAISSSSVASSSSEANIPLSVTSTDLSDGEFMDTKFGATYNQYQGTNPAGINVSPQIAWSSVIGANSYALEMRDLDSPSTHWAIINIPADVLELEQNVKNDFKGMVSLPSDYAEANFNTSIGYVGPFPSAGVTHNYEITIYAVGSGMVDSLDEAKKASIESSSISPKFKW